MLVLYKLVLHRDTLIKFKGGDENKTGAKISSQQEVRIQSTSRLFENDSSALNKEHT